MSTDSLATCYQKNKEKLQKRVVKAPKSLQKEKNENINARNTKISLKMKNKVWLSIGKTILKKGKTLRNNWDI